MNKEILLKILKLDSLINCLEWEERMKIHFFINNKSAELSENIIEVYDWIKLNSWNAPMIQYGQDRLQYFYCFDSEKWHPVETFINKSELNQSLIILKTTLWKHRAQKN